MRAELRMQLAGDRTGQGGRAWLASADFTKLTLVVLGIDTPADPPTDTPTDTKQSVKAQAICLMTKSGSTAFPSQHFSFMPFYQALLPCTFGSIA